jgi:hypothetical protein
MRMATATAVKERPIVLTPDEVRAILRDGRARLVRAVSPRPFKGEEHPDEWLMLHGRAGMRTTYDTNHRLREVRDRETGRLIESTDYYVPVEEWLAERCPFGKPGEARLWGRETWAPSFKAPKCQVAYAADGRCYGVGGDGDGGYMHVFHGWLFDSKVRGDQLGDTYGRSLYQPWRSSTAMPRWASRLALDLAGVTAEQAGGAWGWVLDVARGG